MVHTKHAVDTHASRRRGHRRADVVIRTRASRATTTSGVLDPNDDGGVKFVCPKTQLFHHPNLDVFTVVFTPQPTRNHGFDDGDADDGARAARRATRWDDDA